MEIKRNREDKTFRIRQMGAVEEVISRATRKFRIQSVPRSPYTSHIRRDEPVTKIEHEWYRSIVGQLQHISRYSRPDICYATNMLARHVHAPVQDDINNALDIWKAVRIYTWNCEEMICPR